ncbi:GSCFA domain-containing protein [Agaribacter flavus]|uniref:GSCFA domain-containing protein n=1 Tax=Agaribacter flavus TaxID=1902781 RepID=A0ABV7FSD6_9ALTE
MNPYNELPPCAFWKTAVAQKSMFDISELWQPKFKILPEDKVASYGSCFAQHIGKALQNRGFSWFISEPAPFGLSEQSKTNFNFDVFSSRTGNIYTTSLLNQWVRWSVQPDTIPCESWCISNRYYDPFRPAIEPNGFLSHEEMESSRKQTLRAFYESIAKADYFVFTLGLTESWFNSVEGYEYPMCPGTVAGTFDDNTHGFRNQQFNFVLKQLVEALELMRTFNSNLKFILTVSPVPLTATKSGKHVLTATMQSKSILRAVAGQLADNRAYVDYFPSYEIVNSPVFKGSFFEPNLRSVNPYGVNFVMDMFFSCLRAKFGDYARFDAKNSVLANQKNACEEELLDAFGGSAK